MNVADSAASGIIIVYRKGLRYYIKLGRCFKKLISQEDMLLHLQTEYLALMEQYTGRNVIAYYSAFMQKPGLASTAINDNDKIAFVQMVSQIEKKNRKNGLDLILHTPGGDIAATESLVYYLKQIFGRNIRVFVPQMAMSAGTMIALASKEIIMGKESSLGPIDPLLTLCIMAFLVMVLLRNFRGQ